jgi:flagellar motor switch protein FliN/FliY
MSDSPLLTSTEIDIIGEVLNISMGAAATAISVILNRQVSITTPFVRTVGKNEFEYKSLEPVIGVRVNYIEGLHGSNFMIMNISDARAIVTSLLGDEIAGDGELDEIQISALGEIMNQMMGSASTALSKFLHKTISISLPSIVEPNEFLGEFLASNQDDSIVSVSFKLIVQDLVDNEFITVFPLAFTKEIVKNVLQLEDMVEEEDEAVEYKDAVTGHKPVPEFDMIEEEAAQKQKGKSQSKKKGVISSSEEAAPKAKKNVSVRNLELEKFDEYDEDDEDEARPPVHEGKNLDLLMDIALNITVEIGSTKRAVKEVVNLTKGSIIELDKHADDPVDILVNGQLFARGDVVVVEDNFGVRITEVVNNKHF